VILVLVEDRRLSQIAVALDGETQRQAYAAVANAPSFDRPGGRKVNEAFPAIVAG
jgi:hypothetical protein